MINYVDHERWRRARAWVGEVPSTALIGHPVYNWTQIVPVSAPKVARLSSAALECFVPKGGKFDYGLLGAELQPGAGNTLLARVAGQNGVELQDALCGSLDQVRLGATEEYALAVLDTCSELATRHEMPAGTLSFRCIAHGAVGSSPALFSDLTIGVIRLLTSTKSINSDADLRALLRW